MTGPDGTADPGRPGRPVIRRGTELDAGRAGELHAGQISGGFLSFLGPRFLARLYRRIVRSPSSFLLVADVQGRVAGFVAGSGDVRGLYRAFILRDGLSAAWSAAPRILQGWRRVLETLRHGAPDDSDGDGRGRGIELLAIAVDPSHQGRGIGGDLVDAFLERVREDGAGCAYVVVEASNATAVGLYRRAGFMPTSEFELHAGTRSLLMQWDDGLPTDDGGVG